MMQQTQDNSAETRFINECFSESDQAPVDCRKGIPGLLTLPDSPGREYCGEIDINIDANGNWFHEGSPFTRKDLICLFASVLKRDEKGDYWIATPAELGRIKVDDAPFLAVEMFVTGTGKDQVISFRTNIDEMVTVEETHPLQMLKAADNGDLTPYVGIRGNMEAKISRSVYYELVSHGIEEEINGKVMYGVWSSNKFFPLGSLDTS
ncbi:MAG: DUF1285 domain-containing protein [Alphaproteobacteria bacterium]|nr:DUF1285 domain-containing protein [Rhodospirillales bacterium]MCW9046203.1 DUF1285 domain-containing protein [Alphaproteobacteria bacterium]